MEIALKRLKSLKCQFLVSVIFEVVRSQIPKILGSIPVTFLVKNSEGKRYQKILCFLNSSFKLI